MEEIVFTEGFEYKSFIFGWRGKKLFRLPSKVHGNHYGLRKLSVIKITDKIKGYRIARDKKSMSQVQEMTKSIKVTVPKSACKGC